MEIENSGLEDCKLDFAGLKIENFQYLDFGHMVNMDLETDMDIEYSEIGNFVGLKQNNYLDSSCIQICRRESVKFFISKLLIYNENFGTL